MQLRQNFIIRKAGSDGTEGNKIHKFTVIHGNFNIPLSNQLNKKTENQQEYKSPERYCQPTALVL